MVDANLHIGVNCVNSGNEIAHDEAMHLNPVNSNEPKESEVRINDDQHPFVMQIRKLIRFVLVTQKRGLHVCLSLSLELSSRKDAHFSFLPLSPSRG